MLLVVVIFILMVIIIMIKYIHSEKKMIHGMNGIPSYIDALDSDNTTINLLNKILIVNHNGIIEQVDDMLENLDNSIYDQIKNDQNFKNVQNFKNFQIKNDQISKTCNEYQNFKNDEKLNPIWIKNNGRFTIISEKLTILKRIIELFPNIYNVFISVFKPGMNITSSKSNIHYLQRYHYGIKVSNNDVGLKIGDYDVKWVEKNGFLWDNTIEHSMWNHTTEARIVLFVDIKN